MQWILSLSVFTLLIITGSYYRVQGLLLFLGCGSGDVDVVGSVDPQL